MRNLKSYLLASVALACCGGAEQANAQYAYGGGATFPSIVYRQLFDCLYIPADGTPGKPGPLGVSAFCPTAPFGDVSGFAAQQMYAPVGSGKGKAAFIANSSAALGAVGSTNIVPYTSTLNPTYPYPGHHFTGSDDVINPADAAAWVAAGNPAKFGRIVQLPTIAGPVPIAFKGTDGTGAALNILNATPPGGTSGLNLSRKALCGIVSGHITKWDNPILTALNGGVLGTGNITFVHRLDGSGTSFIFTNAMSEQCRFEFGPMNESVSTLTSYAFPWTDKTIASSLCSSTLLTAQGSNLSNWPDFSPDQCGVAVSNPGGGIFLAGTTSGNSGVIDRINNTNGSIGYSSADFVQPVVSQGNGGLPTANIQSQWDISAVTGLFQPPTTAGTTIAMSAAVPVFDATTRLNPLAWSLQGTQPNPGLPGAYPIAGFTWMDLYQCYAPGGNNGLTIALTFFNFLYGSPAANDIINAAGFVPAPGNWVQQVYQLIADPATGPTFAGSDGCTGIGPGAS